MRGEARRTFECFGGIASVNVGGRGPEMGAEEAALAPNRSSSTPTNACPDFSPTASSPL